jgi:acetyl-CoA carboxylase biotin carboxylase subunit
VAVQGCAIECRINAEDADNQFMPSPGTVSDVHWPVAEGIRVDTHIAAGSSVPPYYDSLLAKIIAHGSDRSVALHRLRTALSATRIAGVHHNVAFQIGILNDEEFQRGGVDTGYLSRHMNRRSGNG